ncbi:MAG: hypothetical protein BM563_04195 [Bacteroidetes bacterium MedPE-SWsnd-G1]|nr:MAG: hypothetical protein BM563_04195 [Bacteroidetes bacterium MedPE-SWsnd-G1]
MIKKFLIIAILFASVYTNAQINEIGITASGSNYVGDIGRENFIYPNNYAIGLIYKYNLNPRIALRGTYTYSKISADDADSENLARQIRNYKFTNTLHEFAAGVEFSFIEYDLSTRVKTHTPYILLELAGINYNVATSESSPGVYNYEGETSFSIPFGLGYKFKIAGHLAAAVEIGMRYTFSDDLDYNNASIPALDFGNPNNNDWYAFSGINLVYTFGRPACYATPK